MAQSRTTNRLNVWPVVFPEEKLIVKRPCLRYICQGSTQLGELLSYFLYEAGYEAKEQNVDPLTIHTITIYRIYEEILVAIDNSVSERVLIRTIRELERLGFLQASPQHHRYSIFLENIRQALASYAKKHPHSPKHPQVPIPTSIIHWRQNDAVLSIPSEVDDGKHEVDDGKHEVDDGKHEVDDGKHEVDDGKHEVDDGKHAGVEPSTFDIDPATPSQADSMGGKDDARYKRDNRDKEESNRERSGEADAIATPPSSLSSPSSVVQEACIPQKGVQEGAASGEMAAKLQKEQNSIKDDRAINIGDNVLEKPDCTQQATVEALQALADHYRGYRLRHSKKSHSQYCMAQEAAITLVAREKTLVEVDAVFSYMKGIDQAFCDDWWPLQTVDLWHVARHFDSMVRKIAHRRACATVASAISQAGQSRATVELMEMSLEERKVYLAQIREKMQQGM